ncbi:MAG: hypothetical protein IKD22_05150 [Lentisphaeria bacterium]|nr:hypothetical protein [Lentisphaeria bacterium]
MSNFSTPLDGGFWINDYNRPAYDQDVRTQLLRRFTLDSLPPKCELRITADARYILWVNGQWVNQGPARGYPESYPFDRVDIAPFLRCGENTLAVLHYRPGLSFYSYIYGGANGFICAGECNGIPLYSDDKWLYRDAPGVIPAIGRAAGQYGFQEFFDCTKDDWSWIEPDYQPDDSWKTPKPEELRVPGSPPWTNFEERGIPLLRQSIRGSKIVRYGTLTSHEDFRCDKPMKEYLKLDRISWDDNHSGGVAVHHFGGEVFGHLIFEIDSPCDGGIVDFFAFEAFADGLPSLSASSLYGGRLKLRRGHNRHILTMPWGFKAVMTFDRSGGTEIKISARETVYPMDVRGKFVSNDPQLNKLWEISVNSQIRCMCDAYVDGPWRECAQWWGDALVQARNTIALTDDLSLLVRGERQFAQQQAPEGLTYGVAPALAPRCVLPDYCAIFMASCHVYYRHTGSLSLYHEVYDRLVTILDYFDRQSCDGLMKQDKRFWLFVDWCPELDKEEAYNLIAVYGIDKLAELARLAGDQALAKRCKTVADRIASCVTLKNPSPHAAAMAVLTGRFAGEHERLKNEVLLPLFRAGRKFDRQPSPYFMFFVFEAAKLLGCRAEVIACIREWWQSFVDGGLDTTPEKWLEVSSAGTSRCHAWSAHVPEHFEEILLGIRQTGVNWSEVEFDPLVLPGFKCEGVVPTPRGDIFVSIDDGKFTVTLPESIKLVDVQHLLK